MLGLVTNSDTFKFKICLSKDKIEKIQKKFKLNPTIINLNVYNTTESLIISSYYLTCNCIDYTELRISHLKQYYNYLINIEIDNKLILLSNSIYACLAYDIYLSINKLNYINNNFKKNHYCYYIQLLQHSNTNNDLMINSRLDNKLIDCYNEIINNNHINIKYTHYILNLNNYIFENILIKILKINNINYKIKNQL